MIFLKFRISGINLNKKQIDANLGIKADVFYKKGQQIIYKNELITYDEDCWMINKEISEDEYSDISLLQFLDQFKYCEKYIKALSDDNSITLWITLYPDNFQTNIHISNDALNMAGNMGIDIDICAMYLQEFYKM